MNGTDNQVPCHAHSVQYSAKLAVLKPAQAINVQAVSLPERPLECLQPAWVAVVHP